MDSDKNYIVPDNPGFTLKAIYKTTSHASCADIAMMLESMGIENEVRRIDNYYALFVHEKDVPHAAEQLRLYSLENKYRPRAVKPVERISNGQIGALIYSIVLILIFMAQQYMIFDRSITELGRAQAGLIQDGEWWRVITALTLHSGIVHLVGNIIFGVLFGVLVSQSLGSGVTWLAILMAGALGNMSSGFIKASHFSAIGASTGTFAALGILSAYTWQHRKDLAQSGFRRWTPIFAGLALLAFLGGPGERVDVLSHVTGFVSGILLGSVLGVLRDRLLLTMRVQVVCGIATISLIVLAWMMAVLKTA